MHEMRLSPHLVVLDSLELHLLVLEVENAILVHHLVDLLLLGLHFVICATIRLISALHILHDPRLRVQSILRKLLPIALLGLKSLPHHVLLRAKSRGLLIIHLRDELLPSLQLLDTLICALLLHAQLYDTVLQLQLLVLLLLGRDDCVHHYVLGLLGSHTAHARGQILVLYFVALGRLDLRGKVCVILHWMVGEKGSGCFIIH